jgi:hypothetical protein
MKIRNFVFPLGLMLAGSISGCAGGPDEAEGRSMFLGLAYQYFFPDTVRKIERHAENKGGLMDVGFSGGYAVFKFGSPDVMSSRTLPFRVNSVGSPELLSNFVPSEPQVMHMTIYLDGDFSGWEPPYPQRDSISSGNYMMLDKALADPTPSMYMVLKCEHVEGDEDCQAAQWKQKRFSKAAVKAFNDQLNSLVERKGVVQFSLVGYGSGAAMALAIAGQRTDIASVTTLSGVLDPVARAKSTGENLVDAYDPMVNAKHLALIPQRHYVVDTKEDASSALVDAYAKNVGGSCTEVVKVPGRLFFSWDSVSYQQMNIPGPRCR